MPVIPNNPTRKHPHPFDRTLYRAGNAVERTFARLTDWRRLATGYDTLALTFPATAVIAAIICYWQQVRSLDGRHGPAGAAPTSQRWRPAPTDPRRGRLRNRRRARAPSRRSDRATPRDAVARRVRPAIPCSPEDASCEPLRRKPSAHACPNRALQAIQAHRTRLGRTRLPSARLSDGAAGDPPGTVLRGGWGQPEVR